MSTTDVYTVQQLVGTVFAGREVVPERENYFLVPSDSDDTEDDIVRISPTSFSENKKRKRAVSSVEWAKIDKELALLSKREKLMEKDPMEFMRRSGNSYMCVGKKAFDVTKPPEDEYVSLWEMSFGR